LRAIRRQSGIDQEEVDPTWTRALFRVCLQSPTVFEIVNEGNGLHRKEG
jgi:hypothetical protein